MCTTHREARVTELADVLLLWTLARQALAAGARAFVPLRDPSTEPFPPL